MKKDFVAEVPTYIIHNKHVRQASIPSALFEIMIPAIKLLQTHSLVRTTTGVACCTFNLVCLRFCSQFMLSIDPGR